jgi:hypothetical protein
LNAFYEKKPLKENNKKNLKTNTTADQTQEDEKLDIETGLENQSTDGIAWEVKVKDEKSENRKNNRSLP